MIIGARDLSLYQSNMGKERWLLFGLAGLGLFAAGYLAGRQGSEINGGGSTTLTLPAREPVARDSFATFSERTKLRQNQSPAAEKQTGYRKIVEMVSKGELRIEGVDINYGNFLPGEKVAEFFGLSEEQLAEMKRIGFERLQEKQRRE